jgi:hypothetical protein
MNARRSPLHVDTFRLVLSGVAALVVAGCGGDPDAKVEQKPRDPAAGQAQVTIHVAEMSDRLKLY